ncbi:hypothetical protein PsorP6_010665 [Peronosclerospora sorghi]|uniref:Uncharacterized protein n=1 Tax=Peronosclerospora sorghi TaxID=230839 RepID=A0ACC0VW85_9STRA|nr:hypothetical protein PsorP6_010665 [Peronosclerospora sorghi]
MGTLSGKRKRREDGGPVSRLTVDFCGQCDMKEREELFGMAEQERPKVRIKVQEPLRTDA